MIKINIDHRSTYVTCFSAIRIARSQPMAVVQLKDAEIHFKIETEYLRCFAENFVNEVGFNAEAEFAMRSADITLPDLNYALKHGVVIESEKEDADKAIWVVVGETCDEEELLITLEVHCNSYQVCVVRIMRVERAAK